MEDEQNKNQAGGGYWDWLNIAKTQALEIASKAQVMAQEATKVAQEKAVFIAKQAQEIRESYDLEVATSILMSTVGNPPESQKKSKEIKLTAAVLRELDMVYITENLIAMGFPKDLENPTSAEVEGNDINVVAAYLKKKHEGRFMIWNISEESYDYSKFADQVLEYKFPGHPAPPLGLLFKICTSVESWLDADEKNIAVVHCLTGKGRTATLMACILTWLGEFDSPMQALQYVAQRKNTHVDYLTIPSQRRYIQYFSNLLDGVRPNSEPILLRKVIINSIPTLGAVPEKQNQQGCCPYIQLFKNGKLIASAAVDREQSFEDNGGFGDPISINQQMQLKWVTREELSASFTVDCLVQGDILLRCRHAAQSGARVSMFRAAFHTGYISGGVLRLTKAQCDGAAGDARFDEEFFVDLMFSPANSVTSSGKQPVISEAALSDKYETGLHKDARFWDSISASKNKSKKRKTRKFQENQQDRFSISDALLDESPISSSEIGFTMSSASNVPVKSYVDEDLLSQLAELEESEGTGASRAAGKSTFSSSVVETKLSEDDNGTIQEMSGTNQSTPQSSTKPDILELDDFEKELGLGDLLGTATTSKPSAVQNAPLKTTETEEVDDGDNLEELERYLQSLSNK
jgi:hypothetical protein